MTRLLTSRTSRNGRCVASIATAGERFDESEHCTKSCRTAWSNHDRREGCLLTRKAWESHGQRRRLLRVDKESRKLRVGCVPKRTWSFVVCSGVAGRGHSDSSPSQTVRASTLWCQQEVTMAPRAGASCREGGTRTHGGTSTMSLERDFVAIASEAA